MDILSLECIWKIMGVGTTVCHFDPRCRTRKSLLFLRKINAIPPRWRLFQDKTSKIFDMIWILSKARFSEWVYGNFFKMRFWE